MNTLFSADLSRQLANFKAWRCVIFLNHLCFYVGRATENDKWDQWNLLRQQSMTKRSSDLLEETKNKTKLIWTHHRSQLICMQRLKSQILINELLSNGVTVYQHTKAVMVQREIWRWYKTTVTDCVPQSDKQDHFTISSTIFSSNTISSVKRKLGQAQW